MVVSRHSRPSIAVNMIIKEKREACMNMKKFKIVLAALLPLIVTNICFVVFSPASHSILNSVIHFLPTFISAIYFMFSIRGKPERFIYPLFFVFFSLILIEISTLFTSCLFLDNCL
jgi:hypothetical protein